VEKPKDPVGTFMRLIWKLLMTELKYSATRTQKDLKLLFVLRKQTEKRVEEYFQANPSQVPGLSQYTPNRLGQFVRTVVLFREAEKKYYSCKTQDNFKRMHELFSLLGNDLDAYFNRYPDQNPIDRIKLVAQQELQLS